MESVFYASVIAWALFNIFSSPPPRLLSRLSLLDERYQPIIQHRITKGNQACFVHPCGCLFPLWSLPLFHSHPQPPKTLTHSTLLYTTDRYGSHLHKGTMFSRRSASVSSVANMSTHTHGTHTCHDKAEEYEHGWGLHYGGTGAGL